MRTCFLEPAIGFWLASRAALGGGALTMLTAFGALPARASGEVAAASTSAFVVRDIFGRTLNARGVTLVDWDGYLANPAIELLISPPPDAVMPLTATVTADGARLYFDLPSSFGAGGPAKNVTFTTSTTAIPVLLSIFPDRDPVDESYTMNVSAGGGPATTLEIHVIDQDRMLPAPFAVSVDFSQDRTGFFSAAATRAVLQTAAADWAYFIDDMGLDEVPAGQEQTFIWDPDGFNSGNYIDNASAYTGFLLYAYGIHSDELRSGGEPSLYGGFQSSGGFSLPLKRSGGVEIETQGNFNTLGWRLPTDDDDWWITGNLGDEQNDLYSIAHHEIGHALFFNPAHTNFGVYKNAGFVQDATVLAYHGSYPAIDTFDHFAGEVDNASRRGVFGNEYFGAMPQRRWVVTKLDLLCAQAIGYRLRQTSAFAPLAITDTSLLDGVRSLSYADTLFAAGGIPFYDWTIESGTLPAGLVLDSFTGVITGTPTEAGTYGITVRLRDYDAGAPGVTASTSITVMTVSDVEDDTGTPSGRRRFAAFPNPSSTSPTLRFALAHPGPMRLTLYDSQGRVVRILGAGRLPAGEHELPCDTSNLGSGVYFCRLDDGQRTRVTRIVLRK